VSEHCALCAHPLFGSYTTVSLGEEHVQMCADSMGCRRRAHSQRQRLLDGVHAAVSFTYIDGEASRLKARLALKEAAGWPDGDRTRERLAEIA